jgi:dipeptidyl-peptidase-4
MLALALACLAGDIGARAATDDAFLERYAATYRFRLGAPALVRPTPDGRHVLFLRSGPRSFVRELYELDVATGRERRVLTADDLLRGAEERLTAEERARRERMRLAAKGIATYELSKDGGRILIRLSGRLFVFERAGGKIEEFASEAGPAVDAVLSPDGKRIACVRGNELYVVDVASGTERRLTEGAGRGVTHGLAEFVAQEEMGRHRGFWWSPDATTLGYQRTDTTGVELLTIADGARPERAPRRSPYPRPGRANADVRLGLVKAEGGPTTWVDWDRARYEYLAGVTWDENAPLTLLVQDRRQTESRLLTVDVADGSTTTLLVERDDAWVEIHAKMPRWLSDGGGFLWTTERRGALQLELRNRDGSLRNVVTPLELGLQGLVRYLPGTREVVVRAGDPTESQLYRVPLDPQDGAPRALTNEPGTHSATFNREGTLWVRVSSPLDGDQRWEVIGRDGPTGHRLRTVAESPGFEPNLEFTTVGDAPGFHAVLVRPRDFDPSRRYPVIDHVYGGPTGQRVRKSPRRYLLDQWIADQGYIVVSIDGRGTPNRGRDWQRAVKHDLIRVPLEDQVRGLRALGARYPELDLSRVGIYGWSFGGYFAAMAVMRYPDLFHAGVAGAPVVDWRDYDTHYTERYMDLPRANPEGYDAANVLSHVEELTRPLLVIHGTADDNVYFMHSLKLSDALFRAGKPFEFLPLAGFTHMVPDPLVTKRLYGRMMTFFATHLAEPQASVGD